MILYRLFLLFYPLLAKLISPFNEKAKHWVDGQVHVWEELSALCSQIKGPIIWVHCASYGEFEQGLPIISALKKTYPTHQIWVTFFSPSGYLHRKPHPAVDFVSYLPLDGPTAATKWMEMVQPKCIVFVKYEFWYYYLKLAAVNKIPTFLASAIFRPDQIFFKFYGGFYRAMLQLFTGILVQDIQSKNLITSLLKDTHLHFSGDTRFDRVLDIAATKKTIDWVSKLADGKIIVAGSTWEDDHQIIGSVLAHWDQLEQCNWIIAPHHVDAASIKACRSHFTNAICLSEWLTQSNTMEKPVVLIIDQIGLLSQLYQYAAIAYIGGGFTKDGIHNVLEAAVFGKPVIWGPNDLKYPEAIGLRNAGGGIQIMDASSLNKTLEKLLNETTFSKATGDAALKFVQAHAGATQKTIEYIKQIYVSPIDQKL
ncbi:MAG: 3-deoxy-D-manno-octulosonic acid transferase [Chitinophagaceae bacterium]|nr:3-deoxy-D-manno-octulosonic acid transferase [Chitinophagaceae bacterium]